MLFISKVCKRNGCGAGNCTDALLLPSLKVTARSLLPLSVSLPVCCVAAGYSRPHSAVCFYPGVTAVSVLQKDSTVSWLEGITQQRQPRSLSKERGTLLVEGPLVNPSASGCRGHPGNTSAVMFRGNPLLCHLSSLPGRQDSRASCSRAP